MPAIDILRIRKILGRKVWRLPQEYGPGGWHMTSENLSWTVIVAPEQHEGAEWIHAQIAGYDDMPSYEQLKELHHAVFGDDYAYMVFPPKENVRVLHLWGRADGAPAIPEFSEEIVPA